MAVIYRIRNTKTGKCYIGETKYLNPYERWNQHLNNAKRSKGCPALRDAMRKYGVDSFVFEVLIFCFDEDRFKYEIEYIAKYNTMAPNGYNLTKGGEGGAAFLGKKHSKETVEKIRLRMKEMYSSEENRIKHRENIKQAMGSPAVRKKVSEGVKNSAKFKKAIEEGRLGGRSHEYTPEIRKKISESLKEYFSTYESHSVNIEKHRRSMANAVGRKVYQYSLDGIFLKEHESIRSASRAVNIGSNAISQVLDSPTRISKGFRWKTTGPSLIEHVGGDPETT